MKLTNEKIAEILNLPTKEDIGAEDNEDLHKTLTEQFIKAFKIGFTYGSHDNIENRLEIIDDMTK